MSSIPRKNFADVLESRNDYRKSLTDGKKPVLKEAVLQLTSCHQDTEALIAEVSSNLPKDDAAQQRVLDNILQKCLESAATGCGSSLTIVGSCVSKLLRIARDARRNGCECYKFSKSSLEEAFKTIRLVSNTVDTDPQSRQSLHIMLCKESCLPLQYLWKFDNDGVMPLELYLNMKSSQTGFVGTISELLISQQKNREDEDVSHIKGVFSKFATYATTNKPEMELVKCKKVSMAILDSIIQKYLDSITSGDMTLHVPDISSACSTEVLRRYSTHVIPMVMCYKPELKVADALMQQKKWIFAASPTNITDWFKQLLLPMDGRSVLDLIKLVLDRQEINWQTVLTFLSTFLVCVPDVSQMLLDYITEMLRDGLEESNIESLVIGFLLARQGCYEGAHVFMSYQDWFQNVFGDGNKSPANSRKSFTSLIKFLTDMVPYESPQHLKTHILRPPFVPPKSRELFNDYVMLAKTRLADLKHPMDTVNSSDDLSGASVSGKVAVQIEDEIQKALVTFDSNKKIPMSVMEASIFRKPYFLGKFLPILLKPRPTEKSHPCVKDLLHVHPRLGKPRCGLQIFETQLPDVPDLKMKFIEALVKVEKIPPQMYKSYQSGCKHEAARLLEGVFLEDEDSISDMDMEPLDQLSHKLDQLLNVVECLPRQKEKVPEMVAVVKEKLLAVVDDSSQSDLSTDALVLDMACADTPAVHLQAVDHILNFMCKASDISFRADQPDMSWASHVMSVISEVKVIHRTIFTRIWKLVIEQSLKIEPHHVRGLACILALFPIYQEKFRQVQITAQCLPCSQIHHNFADMIWDNLPVYSEQWMTFSLRLLVDYLQCVFVLYDPTQMSAMSKSIFTPAVSRKFLYQRLTPQLCNGEDGDLGVLSQSHIQTAHCIAKAKKFKDENTFLLSFEDWLKMEMEVAPEEDCLCFEARQEYLYNSVYNKYLKSRSEEGGCEGDYQRACSVILKQIISYEIRDRRTTKSEGCQKCNLNRGHRYHGSRATFISLLQEMCCFISSDCESRHPWLLQELSDLVKTAEDAVEKHCILSTFTRLLVCLPPYLFYTNNTKQTDQDLSEPCSVIETLYRNFLCDSCYLPCHVTIYLLQGLYQLSDPSRMSFILKDSPLLGISVMIHNMQTDRLMEQRCCSDQFTGCDFYKVYGWMQRCRNGSITSPPVVEDSSAWMYAGALLSLTLNRFCSREQTKEILSMFMSRDVESSCMNVTDLFCVLLFVQLVADDIGTSDITIHAGATRYIEELLQYIIMGSKTQLRRIVQYLMDDLVAKLVPDFLIKLVCPRILRFVMDKLGGKLPCLEDGLESVILLYSNTVREFDIGHLTSDKGRLRSLEKYSISSIQQLSSFVKQNIQEASRSALMGIEKVVKSCGPDIMQSFNEALSRN